VETVLRHPAPRNENVGRGFMTLAAFQIAYDVSRDWGQILVPLLLTGGWLLGFVVAVRIMRNRSDKKDSRFVILWLAIWVLMGGFGFGHLWYQHFHCVSELKSGHFLQTEGPITYFRPEAGKTGEKFTVGNETFEYYSANLGGGGMRYTSGSLHVGTYVRVTYDRNRMILRLEVRHPD
jgi:hypothetical protein